MAVFSVYCIGMTLFSTALPEVRLTLFLGCIVIIGFLVYPANKKKVRTNYIPWYDILLMIIGAACFFYFAFNALPIIKLGTRIDEVMIVIGIVGILVVAELCRRSVGLPIIFVVAALLVYAFYFFVVDRGMDLMLALRTVVYRMFYTTNGIIEPPSTSATPTSSLFIIFGAFLERTGIAGFFISFANRIAGWSSGGAAKVAVISSALCGMVSGSSVGNTVTTGSVTSPMMKKTGQARVRRSRRGRVFDGWPDHAAHHGRRRLDGRVHGHPLHRGRRQGHHPRVALLHGHLPRGASRGEEAPARGASRVPSFPNGATSARTATSSSRSCCSSGSSPRARAPWPYRLPSLSWAPSSSASSTSS